MPTIKRATIGTVEIPPHNYDPNCTYRNNGFCYWCCGQCNYDTHKCGFCGAPLDHNDRTPDGVPHDIDRCGSD